MFSISKALTFLHEAAQSEYMHSKATTMMLYKALLLFLLVSPRSVASLSCYSCTKVDSLESCKGVITCSNKQSCFTRSEKKGQIVKFTMGCTQNTNCGNIPVYNYVSKFSGDETVPECNECCGFDKCNNELCKNNKPPPCIDTEDNCSFWNKACNICEEIHNAKRHCRKFCKLCDLADGNWASWSAWSSCDVTCGQGKHTKTRTCTNPAPAYRGLDCIGSSVDFKPCIRPLCPVHGGWSLWSSWDSCPVTCDEGIQKRHRTCNNPSPLRHGDHCFGDTLDVKLCKQKPCDGSSVAFNAYHLTSLSPALNQTMIFSKVLLNKGEAYNNSTGIFVAPRNGTYTFNAQLCIVTGYSLMFDIVVEKEVYATGYGHGYKNNECQFTQAIAWLKTGDKVYVQWKRIQVFGKRKVQHVYIYTSATPAIIIQSDGIRNFFAGKFSSP